MDFNTFMNDLSKVPIEFILSFAAVMGGVARYMSNVRDGIPFRMGMFFASVIASGFSGVMFGLVGISMNLPDPIIFMMAGSGGFFADQAMKFVLEFVSNKAK